MTTATRYYTAQRGDTVTGVTRGDRIRRERRRQKLTIRALAEEVGLSESAVSRIERGVSRDPRSGDAIEAYLGIAEEVAPARAQYLRLDQAIDLVFELHRGLVELSQTAPGEPVEPALLPGPPEQRRSTDGPMSQRTRTT